MYFSILVGSLKYIYSPRGTPLVLLDNYLYRNNRGKYWRCFHFVKHRCKARLIIDNLGLVRKSGDHSHEQEVGKINFNRKLIKTGGSNARRKIRLPKDPKLKLKNRKNYQMKVQQVTVQQEELLIKKEEPDIDLEPNEIKAN